MTGHDVNRTTQFDDTTFPVCHKCLGDKFLKDNVRREGKVDRCNFCSARTKCITIETLSEWVAKVLEEHFQEGPSLLQSDENDHTYYEQDGNDLDYIVGDIIEADSDVVSAILDVLCECSYAEYKDGDGPRFDREAKYIETKVSTYEIDCEWNQFRQELKHRSRFFNSDAKNFLDRLMQDINTMRALGMPETPVIHSIGPELSTKFYRARRADKPHKLKAILNESREQLGPPPPELATTNRMNAEGISAFYGSFDRKTAIAELRPSIGSTVVTAEFRLQKPVRVLDFKLLEKCYHEQPLSYFQSDFNQKVANRHFLQHLHSKIRQPVLPGEENEYLITQVLSEYLVTFMKPPIDGILFSSVQWEKGLNVVLFGSVLDIQLDSNRDSIMGPNSALMLLEESVSVHRIKLIDYGFDDHTVKNGKVVWAYHENEYYDDFIDGIENENGSGLDSSQDYPLEIKP
jgi:hypothetical protein